MSTASGCHSDVDVSEIRETLHGEVNEGQSSLNI